MTELFKLLFFIRTVHTNYVLGNMFAWYFSWLAKADFVNSCDATLVLCFVNEILDNVAGVLEVPGDVAANPVGGVGPLAFHQVPNNWASSIVSRDCPGETDGAVGGVSHTGVQNRSRRSWWKAH